MTKFCRSEGNLQATKCAVNGARPSRGALRIMAEFAFDKRGLKALALAIVSHGLLLVLLRRVLQMLFIT